MAKYKAIITQRDGTRICLDLSCREYHAQKLNYIFSRTLDRAIYMDAAVVACDAVKVDAAPSRRTRKPSRRTRKTYYFGCIHQINGDCPILQGGEK